MKKRIKVIEGDTPIGLVSSVNAWINDQIFAVDQISFLYVERFGFIAFIEYKI